MDALDDPINRRALDLARKALDGEGTLSGAKPARFVFVSISGAHLYGFPSADSDLDLRGAHLLSLHEAIGLRTPAETYTSGTGVVEGIEVDCVSHDLRKYLSLLTRKNGYVLEQIFSPLVVFDGGDLEELRELARGAMTRHVVHHYLGFMRSQERLLMRENPPRAKTLLYLFRVAMTGLHLLRSGEVEANLLTLNREVYKFSYIDELVDRKRNGAEKGAISTEERDRFLAEAMRLEAQLLPTADASALPDEVPNLDAIDDFLRRMRLSQLS